MFTFNDLCVYVFVLSLIPLLLFCKCLLYRILYIKALFFFSHSHVCIGILFRFIDRHLRCKNLLFIAIRYLDKIYITGFYYLSFFPNKEK